MKPSLLVFAACLTLAACATMDANECRSANWYDLGFRDAMYGLQRQDEVYAFQCGKLGAQAPDRAQYAKGWQEGLWEFEQRKIHGGSE